MDLYILADNGMIIDVVYGYSKVEVEERYPGIRVIRVDSIDIDRMNSMMKAMKVLR